MAAQHASAIEVESLEAMARHFDAAPTVEGMARSNRMLHDAIMRSARNRFLESALTEFRDGVALLGPTTFGVEGRPEAAGREHLAIVTAIAVRNAEVAETAARHHIRESLRARIKLQTTLRDR